MNRNEVLRILEEQDLPTLPEVIGRIQEAYEREKTSAQEMAAILESDSAVSARILKLANSAYYGLPKEVASVPRAVVVLGFTAVRDLALTTAIFDTFSGKRASGLDPERFWIHSLGTAKAANLVVKKYCPRASAEGCFTVGLLHDIGKLLLGIALSEEYAGIIEEAKSSDRPLHEVERTRLGIDHAEIGSFLAERWNLPNLFVEVIRNLPSEAKYNGPFLEDIRAVAIGHNIARSAGFDGDGSTQEPRFDKHLIGPIGLTEEQLEGLQREVSAYGEMAAQFFHILQAA